jgi:hypothetical protein
MKPIPFEKVGKLWDQNSKTRITSDVFSIVAKVSTGAVLFAGLREEGFENQFYQSSFKKSGADTVYILMHGRPLENSMMECGTPLVFYVGESDKDIPQMNLKAPKDWPKRGFQFNLYKKESERNYAKMAFILTKQNPKWLITLCCNHDDKDPTMGGSPEFFRKMILLPDDKINLEWVVMNEPGQYGFAKSWEEALEYEGGGFINVKTASKTFQAKQNAPQLYHVSKKKSQWVYEDRGTYTLGRSFTTGVEGLSELEIEKFEIGQIGPAEYKRFCADIFDQDVQNIVYSLMMRPQFAEAVGKITTGDLYSEDYRNEINAKRLHLKKVFLQQAESYEAEMKKDFGKKWCEFTQQDIYDWKRKHPENFYYSQSMLDNRLAPVAERSSIALASTKDFNQQNLYLLDTSFIQIPTYPLPNRLLRFGGPLLRQK